MDKATVTEQTRASQQYFGCLLGSTTTVAEKQKAVEDAIMHFKAVVKCEHLIVTGSYALYKYGLITAFSDLDLLVVNPTTEAKQIIIDLQKTDDSKHLISDYAASFNVYRILFNGIKIDFHCVNLAEPFMLLDSGIKLATIKGIVKAKLKANRLKDLLQLREIAKVIYEDSMFKTFMESELTQLKNTTDSIMRHKLEKPKPREQAPAVLLPNMTITP